MTTRETILQTLRSTADFVSGERLSQQCGISRAAVWKQIQKLQSEGYEIESQHRVGYRLVNGEDILNREAISRGLPHGFLGKKEQIFCYEEIDSTNLEARRLILQGYGQGTVIVAKHQTAGRGRLGRHWESPAGTGIWFSVILEPKVDLQRTSQYSFVIAVAVAQGIRAATGLPAQVKWPNDILIGGKKVCGILLELVAEMRQVHQLIVGIGINANQEQRNFPEEMQMKATSLAMEQGQSVRRTEVLCAVLQAIEENYDLLEEKGFDAIRQKWMKLSCVIGREVQVVHQDKSILSGIAVGLADDGALQVRTEQGMELVTVGDVSLRAADGSYFLV